MELLVDFEKFQSVPVLNRNMCLLVPVPSSVSALLFNPPLDIWFNFKTIVIKLAVAEECCQWIYSSQF